MSIYKENIPKADMLMGSMRSMGYSFESAIADVLTTVLVPDAHIFHYFSRQIHFRNKPWEFLTTVADCLEKSFLRLCATEVQLPRLLAQRVT